MTCARLLPPKGGRKASCALRTSSNCPAREESSRNSSPVQSPPKVLPKWEGGRNRRARTMSTSNSETPTPDPSLSKVSERRDLGQGAALQPQPGTPEIERRLRGGNGNPEEGVLGTFLVDPNTYDLLTREGSTGRTHPDGDALSLREALGGPQASRAEDRAPPTAGLRAQRRVSREGAGIGVC